MSDHGQQGGWEAASRALAARLADAERRAAEYESALSRTRGRTLVRLGNRIRSPWTKPSAPTSRAPVQVPERRSVAAILDEIRGPIGRQIYARQVYQGQAQLLLERPTGRLEEADLVVLGAHAEPGTAIPDDAAVVNVVRGRASGVIAGRVDVILTDRMQSLGSIPVVVAEPWIDPLVHRPQSPLGRVALLGAQSDRFEWRLHELLASGRRVLVVGSAPGGRELPPGVDVIESRDVPEMRDELESERSAVAGMRHVHLRHSAVGVVADILKVLGSHIPGAPSIGALVCTRRPDYATQAVAQILTQTATPSQVVVVAHGIDVEVRSGSASTEIRVVRAPASWSLGECLNAGVDALSTDLVARFDDDDLYGPNHITDLLAARAHSGADLVGKLAHFVHFEVEGTLRKLDWHFTESFVPRLPGATWLAPRSLLRDLRFRPLRRGEDSDFCDRLRRRGGELYSTHGFNFVRRRHADNTGAVDDAQFRARCSTGIWEGTPESVWVV